MKSNTRHPQHRPGKDTDNLRVSLKKEKETLVSMFLSNASLVELSEQFKRIDSLHSRLSDNTNLR